MNLKIFNILDTEILALVKGELAPGIYQMKIEITNLASGTYFIKLSTAVNSKTK